MAEFDNFRKIFYKQWKTRDGKPEFARSKSLLLRVPIKTGKKLKTICQRFPALYWTG